MAKRKTSKLKVARIAVNYDPKTGKYDSAGGWYGGARPSDHKLIQQCINEACDRWSHYCIVEIELPEPPPAKVRSVEAAK